MTFSIAFVNFFQSRSILRLSINYQIMILPLVAALQLFADGELLSPDATSLSNIGLRKTASVVECSTLQVVNPCDDLSQLKGQSFCVVSRLEQGCKAQKAARQVQKMMGSLLIIAYNEQFHNNITIMSFHNNSDIRTPVVLVQEHQFAKVLNSKQIKVKMVGSHLQKPEVILWISADNRHSYTLLRQIQPLFHQLVQKGSLTIVYPVEKQRSQMLLTEEDCLYQGKYCHFTSHLNSNRSGKLIIKQEIKQYALFKLYPNLFPRYLDFFDMHCVAQATESLQICSLRILTLATNRTVAQDVLAAYQASNLLGGNSLLGQQIPYHLYKVHQTPLLSVNGFFLEGKLTSQTAHLFICEGFLYPPSDCHSKDNRNVPSLWWLLGVWIVLLVFCVLGKICYSRCFNSQLTNEMKSRIKQSVTKRLISKGEKSRREKSQMMSMQIQ